MKYYKMLSRNSIQEYDKPYLHIDGVQISHPSEELLRSAGIKPLVLEEEPECDLDLQYTAPYYEESEDCIIRKWEIFDIPGEVIENESTES